MDDPYYLALVDHPDGALHLAAWDAIVRIAAKGRGSLPPAVGRSPHEIAGICRTLACLSRLPVNIFEAAVPRLLDEIRWLEEVTGDSQR